MADKHHLFRQVNAGLLLDEMFDAHDEIVNLITSGAVIYNEIAVNRGDKTARTAQSAQPALIDQPARGVKFSVRKLGRVHRYRRKAHFLSVYFFKKI